jgi:hypothetical protein
MGSASTAQFYLKNSSGDLDVRVACSKNNVSTYDLAGYFVNHFNGTGISSTRGNSNGTQVTINENGSVSLTIKTAYVDPKDSTQRIFIENIIADER